MYAAVGDTLIVRPTHVADARRDGEVLEVHGQDGPPPYLVPWTDNGHKGLFFPEPGHRHHAPRLNSSLP